MKKARSILPALALALSLTACGGTPAADGAETAAGAPEAGAVQASADKTEAGNDSLTIETEWPEYAPGVERVWFTLTNNGTETLSTGVDYHLQYKYGPLWRTAPERPDTGWIALGLEVQPGETIALSCWLGMYELDFTKYQEYRIEKHGAYGYFRLTADAPVTPERPCGFAPLEDLPRDYTAEMAAADGCAVFPNAGGPVNADAVDAFLQKAALGIPCQLRIARFTTEGAIVLEDIVYENFNGVSGGRYLWRRDDSRDGFSASPGIDPTSYWSYLIADRRGIALSSSVDSSHSYGVPDLVVLFNNEVTIEQTEAVAAMDDALMESNSTRFRVWSPDGTQWAALTDEPLEFAYGGEGHGESRSLADYDGLDAEILGVSWADEHTLSLVVRQTEGLPDGKPIVIYHYDISSNTLKTTDLTWCVPSYMDPRSI